LVQFCHEDHLLVRLVEPTLAPPQQLILEQQMAWIQLDEVH
jgi:hypothetical protein